ncbi:MAG: DNA-processing protein DprA [Candidatus Brocadia sp.]|nr:DNA-processing protein DprA [Candidatus Brocadia sp.]
MKIIKLHKGDPSYPTALQTYLGYDAPEFITTLGNINILRNKPLALFCSVKCPGNIILQAYDLAQHLQQTGVTVAGGFHSPVERECLTILLRGSQPIIICPARSTEDMRVPGTWRRPIDEGRLLILSPFEPKHRRITMGHGEKRNEFVAAIADRIFVVYATPGGKTEQFCQKVISRGKPLLTFNCTENTNLINMGAIPLPPEQGWSI